MSACTRRLLRKLRQGKAISFGEAFDGCQYRTLIGPYQHDAATMMENLGSTVAILDTDEPEPMSPRVLADAVAELAAGRSVLLLAITSAEAELREFSRARSYKRGWVQHRLREQMVVQGAVESAERAA